MTQNEKTIINTIQQMEELHIIGKMEELQDSIDLFNEIKNNYPCCGEGEFEFEWMNNSFEKSEVNTMLSEADYNCYIKKIISNIDGSFLIVCDCRQY